MKNFMDQDFLLRVLLAREALESTGIGDGIAIPHVRNPVVLHVSRPMITLCFLEQAVDYGALDGKPVNTVFSLISPTVRAHLRLLSRLSFALQDPGTPVKSALVHWPAGRWFFPSGRIMRCKNTDRQASRLYWRCFSCIPSQPYSGNNYIP